jgi:hypothetical protein
VDAVRKTALAALAKDPAGLTVAQLRDLTGGTRRMAILLFQLFETEGIIKRVGDIRVLSKKGQK